MSCSWVSLGRYGEGELGGDGHMAIPMPARTLPMHADLPVALHPTEHVAGAAPP